VVVAVAFEAALVAAAAVAEDAARAAERATGEGLFTAWVGRLAVAALLLLWGWR